MTNPHSLEGVDFVSVRKISDIDMMKLEPELRPYLSEELGMVMLRHPLVYQIPFYSVELANRGYQYRTEAIKEAEMRNDFVASLMFHERPYRMEAMLRIDDEYRLSDRAYWLCVRFIWMDSENMWQTRDRWTEILSRHPENSRWIMDAEERAMFKKLPDTEITLFRGSIVDLNEEGHSWTFNYDTAAWFARRFAGTQPSQVEIARFRKSDILAILLSRGESEVIVKNYGIRRLIRTEQTS